MYKRFMLSCMYLDIDKGIWCNEIFYFDTEEEMVDFVKNGNFGIKPENIRVEAAFELNKLSNNIFCV